MNKRLIIVCTLATVLIALSSCASAPRTVATRNDSLASVTTPVQVSQIDHLILHQEQRSTAIRSIHLDGSITTTINQASQTGRVVCALKGRDSLLITVYAPFGIVIGRLQATAETMIFYNALENALYEGTPSKESFQRFLGMPYSFTELASLLRAEPPFGFQGFKRTSDSAGRILYVRPNEDKRERLVYTAQDTTITEYASRSLAGDLVAVVRYSDYVMTDNVHYPKAILLSAPARSARADAQWTSIRFNDASARYSFSLPQGIPKYRF